MCIFSLRSAISSRDVINSECTRHSEDIRKIHPIFLFRVNEPPLFLSANALDFNNDPLEVPHAILCLPVADLVCNIELEQKVREFYFVRI